MFKSNTIAYTNIIGKCYNNDVLTRDCNRKQWRSWRHRAWKLVLHVAVFCQEYGFLSECPRYLLFVTW